MKKLTAVIAGIFAMLVIGVDLHAQLIPPGGGGSYTNAPDTNTYTYTPPPYVPGLKVAVQPLSSSNLCLNLREADPAGTYDIFSASNLIAATWNDVLQGTNGQTNFNLPFPFVDMVFFRAARTDTPVTNTSGMTVSFPNPLINTNLVQAIVTSGPATAMAVLVNDTNLADAIWIPFSSVPLVLLGTNDGVYQVTFGFIGSDGQTNWTSESITIDTVPPQLVITSPTNSTLTQPVIQLTGYSQKALALINYDITNATGFQTNQMAFVTSQFTDTNLWKFTTNYFQAFDVPLTNGLNIITFHATDHAGNSTVLITNFTVDYSSKTNPPAVQINWPQNGAQISGTYFTLDGQVDDPTATVKVQIVSTNTTTNTVSGLVGRDGIFWVENLPLNAGTNALTLTVTDAAGNSSVTNISVIQSALTLTMNPVTPDSQLWQPTVNLNGAISDAGYAVWVNGVKGTNNGDGTWSANNVPTTQGGTTSFTVTGYAPNEQQPDGSYGN
jgi:hypothetical protein